MQMGLAIHLFTCSKEGSCSLKEENNDFISSVFLVAKTDSGYRLILNVKQFNKNIETIHFKVETLQHILYLIEKNCYMTRLDYLNAFLMVAIKPAHTKYLIFEFERYIYKYLALSCHYKDSPQIYTKIPKLVLPICILTVTL